MNAFSPSDAALEGFRVIGRHWRVVLGWGLFNLLASIAMIMVAAVALLIVMAISGGPAVGGALGGWIGAGVYGLGAMLISVILICGVYRLMLRPEQPAFLHLRLGPDELRILAVTLILTLAMALPVAITVVAGAALRPLSGALPVVIVLLGLGFALWLIIRMALIPAWTFDAGRIEIVDALWATHRRVWPLIGMWLLNLCCVAMVGIAIWIAMFLVTGFLTGFDGMFASLSDAEAMEARPGRYLLQLAVQVMLGPFFTVLVTAPWVAAYKALGPGARPG